MVGPAPGAAPDELLGLHAAGHRVVVDDAPGHHRHDPSVLVAVPVGHAGVGPHELRVGTVEALGVLVEDVGADLDGAGVGDGQAPQGVEDPADLPLGDGDEAATVAQAGVGAAGEEEVRELGHGDAQVGAGVGVVPGVGEASAVAARDLHRREVAGGLEAGGQHHHVGLVAGARGVGQPALVEADHALGDELDVVATQHAVPPVVEQHPLAEGRVVGGGLLDQVGAVTELLGQVAQVEPAVALVDGVDRAAVVGPRGVDLQRRVDAVVEDPAELRAVPAGVERHVAAQPVHARVDRLEVVLVRRDPLRRALEDRQRADRLGDRGTDLHRAGAGADDGDPLAAQVQAVGPAGGVEDLALEPVETLDVGQLGPVEDADGGDHGVGGQLLDGAVTSPYDGGPGGAVLVEGEALDLGVELHVAPQVVGVGELLQVVLDLVALAEVRRPVPVEERVGVEEARGVDAAAGIGVLPPAAADLAVLLQHHVSHAGLGEPQRGQHPRDAGADDDDRETRGGLGQVRRRNLGRGRRSRGQRRGQRRRGRRSRASPPSSARTRPARPRRS